MAINHLELVSALVDGQLTGSELEQALELINNDSGAREAFMRFQQASDILHGYTRSITQAPLELTSRISLRWRLNRFIQLILKINPPQNYYVFLKTSGNKQQVWRWLPPWGHLQWSAFFSNKTDSTICP